MSKIGAQSFIPDLNDFLPSLLVWGGADQLRAIRPIIECRGGAIDVIIDDTLGLESPFPGIDLLHGKAGYDRWICGRDRRKIGFIIAIGNPYGRDRCRLHEFLCDEGLVPVSISDPSANIDPSASIGAGAQVMRESVINVDAVLGKQCIVNTSAIIEHDDRLDDGVEIAPGATLCGRVHVGNYSWICAGATIIPRINIGKDVIVGAGSVVIRDIADGAKVAGVPATSIE